MPDITFLIDIKPEDAMIRSGLTSPDRIEGAGIELQQDVQKTYLSLAKEFSNRFIILDGYDSISSIHSIIWDKIINYPHED